MAGRFFDDFDEADLLRAVGLYDDDIVADATASGGPAEEVLAGDPAADYSRLCTLAARRAAGTYGRRRTRVSHDPIRLATARRAVLLRSEGRCENPRCARPAPDLNDHGRPLLEVDHVVGLADGGRDDPEQMIALCPNCHRVKTHGRTRHELIVALARTAKERHAQWMTGGDG